MEIKRTLRTDRDQGKAGAEAIIQVSVDNYEEIMVLIVSESYISEEKFLRTHEVAMAAAFKYFRSHTKIPDDAPEVKQNIEAYLNKLIEHAKANLLNQNQKIFQEFNAKKQQILEQTVATFSEKISQITEQQDGLPQKLCQITDERNEISDKALVDVEQLDEATPQLVLAFNKELKAKFDEKVQHAMAVMDQKIPEQEQVAKQVLQDAIDKFQQTAKILSEKIIIPGSCSQILRTAKEGVMLNVSTSLSQINTPNFHLHLDDLSNQVGVLLAQALKENNAKYHVMMETLWNIILLTASKL